jgi:hypothetical protein
MQGLAFLVVAVGHIVMRMKEPSTVTRRRLARSPSHPKAQNSLTSSAQHYSRFHHSQIDCYLFVCSDGRSVEMKRAARMESGCSPLGWLAEVEAEKVLIPSAPASEVSILQCVASHLPA